MWRAPVSSYSIRSLWGQKLRSGHRNLNNRKPSQPMGKLFLYPMESTIKSVVKSLAASQHPLSLKAFVCFSGPWRHSAGASRDRRPRDRIQLSRLWFVVVSKTVFHFFFVCKTNLQTYWRTIYTDICRRREKEVGSTLIYKLSTHWIFMYSSSFYSNLREVRTESA